MECCLQDLFKQVHSILVSFPTSFFSLHFISIYMVHRYSNIGSVTAWKKSCFYYYYNKYYYYYLFVMPSLVSPFLAVFLHHPLKKIFTQNLYSIKRISLCTDQIPLNISSNSSKNTLFISFFFFVFIQFNLKILVACPRGVMVKVTDCRIIVSEFVLQSRYYVHFLANTLEKGRNPLILPVMG